VVVHDHESLTRNAVDTSHMCHRSDVLASF
jgi:hypothetical protein